jgi:hypothetical protein
VCAAQPHTDLRPLTAVCVHCVCPTAHNHGADAGKPSGRGCHLQGRSAPSSFVDHSGPFCEGRGLTHAIFTEWSWRRGDLRASFLPEIYLSIYLSIAKGYSGALSGALHTPSHDTEHRSPLPLTSRSPTPHRSPLGAQPQSYHSLTASCAFCAAGWCQALTSFPSSMP